MTDTNTSASPRRRNWIRRTALGMAALAAAGGIGFKAFAHGDGPGRGHRGGYAAGPVDPAKMEARIERMLRHLYVEIDATDAQKQKLEPIIKQAAKELAPLRGQVRDTRRKAMDLLTGDTVDRAAVETLRAEQMKAADAASKRFTQALADVAEVLTPEQRRTLAQRMSERRRGWHRG